jgi:hypothetical protein
MATRADVEIRGKETVSQEAQKASKSLESLSGQSKTLVKSFTDVKSVADTVIAVIQKVAAIADEAVSAFVEIEKAENAFNAAMSRAPQLIDGAAKRLQEYAEMLSFLTGEDDEAIQSIETFLAQSGRTEEQIKAVMMAAANLAASGFGSLQSNAEMVNLTFSGTTSKLSRLIPELDLMTKISLEAGAAADVINHKYGGLLGTLSSTSDVSIKNFNNMLDHIKGAFGEGIEILVKPLRDSITNFGNINLEDFRGKVKDAALTIQGVFENLPEFCKIIFTAIGLIFAKTFEWGTIGTIFETLVKNILMIFSTGLKQLPGIFNELMKNQKLSPGENAKLMGMNLVNNMASMFGIEKKVFDTKSLNDKLEGSGNIENTVGIIFDAVVAQLKTEGKALNNVGGMFKDIYGGILDEAAASIKALKANEEKPTNTIPDSGPPLVNMFADLEEYYKRSGNMELEKTLGGKWQGDPLEIFKAIENNMAAPDYESFFSMFAQNVYGKKTSTDGYNPMYAPDPLRQALQGAGFVGTGNEQGGITGGTELGNLGAGLASIGGIFSSIGGQFLPFLTSISSVNKIMNPFTTILGGFFEVAGPVLDLVLKPLVDGLEDLGRAAAEFLFPAFKWLAIGIEYVSAPLKWLADSLKWVASQIDTWFYNLDPFKADRAYTEFASDAFSGLEERIAKINEWDLKKIVANSQAASTSSMTGSSTTIQKAPDIYNYFHFHAPVIGAGGAREVGEYVVAAIHEYVGSGGKVTFQEA